MKKENIVSICNELFSGQLLIEGVGYFFTETI